MGKRSLFLGEVGAGARMKLVVNGVMGSMMTAFAEGAFLGRVWGGVGVVVVQGLFFGAVVCSSGSAGRGCTVLRRMPNNRKRPDPATPGMALADRSGLKQSDLLEVLGLGAMACPMIALKGPGLQQRSYPPAFKLLSQQKDMRLALALGCALGLVGRAVGGLRGYGGGLASKLGNGRGGRRV